MSTERQTYVNLDAFRRDDGRVMVDEGHARVVEYVPKAEVERLRGAFGDLLEAAEDMRAYVPDYFAQKWKHDDALGAARAVLAGTDQRQP